MMGLGFVFLGMETMSGGLAPLGRSQFFLNILSSMQNPIFGILVGFVLTTIVQSSSASLGIIQSLAKSGLVTIKDVMFFNLGQNLGSCTTAMLASLSFNRDAKRVSIINFTFNIVNAVLFTILYSLFPFERMYEMLAPGRVVEQIALMHTFTNVVTSLACFPIAGLLSKIAYLIIPDQGSEKKLQPEITQPTNIENNPVFNIYGINIELSNMFKIVKDSIHKSIDAILEHYSAIDEIRKNENEVDLINKGISKNLSLLMASNLNAHESRQAASMFSINIDLERMSDHALNIAEAGEDLVSSDLSFSIDAYDEIHELSQLLLDSLLMIDHIIETGEFDVMERIDSNEEKIDDLCFRYRDIEIERMKKDTDESESGVVYSEMLIDIERIGDHIVNIAESLRNSMQDL
ncbi:MAG: Na/Pi cotransporter family protein, partial [Erysipelotrichaceae bacterium]|nr:Na/Pi cotransporter family protein [Erysipelotrichaceae bacterium]